MDILHPNSDSLKTCSKCGRVLPATAEYFTHYRKSKDGLYNRCKQCKSADDKAYYAAHLEEERTRSRRYRAAHLEEERVRGRRYQAAHREERLAYHKQYYADHKEQRLEYKKRYRKAHQEQENRRRRKCRETHKEEYAAKRHIYYTLHREEYRISLKQYRQTERGILIQRAGLHNRRARKKKAPGSHTGKQLREQYQRQRGRCYYCQKKLGASRKAWHADHIVPLSRGGSNDISNIVVSCPQCNCQKRDKLPHEWAEGGRLL